jgi:hypothetical protein
LIQILISKKFENNIVFESSVLAWIRIRNRIQIEQKCWIRIRIKSIQIHNPAAKATNEIQNRLLTSVIESQRVTTIEAVNTSMENGYAWLELVLLRSHSAK